VAVSDIELVHAAQTGDAAALGELLERYRASLQAAALEMLGDWSLAQDVVHDTYLSALLHISQLRDPAAAGGWLHSIARNACRLRLRARRETPSGIATEASLGWYDDTPLEQMTLRDWVWTALEQLPDDLRATMMLRFFTRCDSYQEIADTLGIPIGTVRSRLHQGRAKLAQALTVTANEAFGDHALLTERRWQWGVAILEEVKHHRRATLYAEDWEPDVVIHMAGAPHQGIGPDDRLRDVIETIDLGIHVQLIGVVASVGVTVLELRFENPVNDPHRCPPLHTEVRFHPHGRTSRVHLSYQHRLPDSASA
jgi:RNA polymerase sigma factor (sigma-70 family)